MGEHVRIQFHDEIYKTFGDKRKTLFIPRYVIFDKKGQIRFSAAASLENIEQLKAFDRNSPCSHPFSVFAGRISCHFLKYPVEMLGILKAQFIGNLVYGLLRIGEHVFGSIYDFTLDVFLRIFSRFFLIPYGRQSVCTRLAALKIIVEQGLETGQHILV